MSFPQPSMIGWADLGKVVSEAVVVVYHNDLSLVLLQVRRQTTNFTAATFILLPPEMSARLCKSCKLLNHLSKLDPSNFSQQMFKKHCCQRHAAQIVECNQSAGMETLEKLNIEELG